MFQLIVMDVVLIGSAVKYDICGTVNREINIIHVNFIIINYILSNRTVTLLDSLDGRSL